VNKETKLAFIAAVSGLFLSACAPFHTGGIRIGDTRARRIAKDATIPGKYRDGDCLQYARALHARFRDAGIRSKVVSFHYETLPVPQPLFGDVPAVPPLDERGGFSGAHAVVVYEDMGRTYVMDNQSWQPKWIHEASPVGAAERFSGLHTLVSDAQVISEPRHPEEFEIRAAVRRPLFRTTIAALRTQLAVNSPFSAWRHSACGFRPFTDYGGAHPTPLFRATRI
jgi:hypothetical protein